MSGKLYKDDQKLTDAYCEGYTAGAGGALKSTNPGPANDTVMRAAWDQGWDDGSAGKCGAAAVYPGAAQCIPDYVPPGTPKMSINKTTAPITGTATTTVTATMTKEGFPMVGVTVTGTSSAPTKATVTASAVTSASGVATFTITGVSAGQTTVSLACQGAIKTCLVTVT